MSFLQVLSNLISQLSIVSNSGIYEDESLKSSPQVRLREELEYMLPALYENSNIRPIAQLACKIVKGNLSCD